MGERGFKIRKILIIFLIVVTAIAIFFNLVSDYRTKDKNSEIKESAPLNESASEKEFCYYRSSASVPDYFDVAWLKIKENDNLVSGEFRNLPTETDSKIGLFEGKIVGFDEENKIKKTEVIWDTFAEGMFAKEELIIDYNDYYVITYFGELYNRGDDVYVFKDKNSVTVVAENKKNEIFLVGQSRYALDNKYSWELPGGSIERRQTALEAAKRELREETGLIAKSWKYLGIFHPKPGRCTEVCHVYLAKNLKQYETELDATEDITVKKIKPEDIFKMIKTNQITDGFALASILKYLYYKNKISFEI